MLLLVQRAAYEEACNREKAAILTQFYIQSEHLRTLKMQTQALNFKLVATEAALKANSKVMEDRSQEVVNLNHRLLMSNNSNAHLMECTKTVLHKVLADLLEVKENLSSTFANESDITALPLVSRLQILDQRIADINNRLPVVRSLFARKSTIRRNVNQWSRGAQTCCMRHFPINEIIPSINEEKKQRVAVPHNEIKQILVDRDPTARDRIKNGRDLGERPGYIKVADSNEKIGMKLQIAALEGHLNEKTQVEMAETHLRIPKNDHKGVSVETSNEDLEIETESANTKTDLSKAITPAPHSERMAMYSDEEKRSQLKASALDVDHEAKIAQIERDLREPTQQLFLRPPLVYRRAYSIPLRPEEVFARPDVETASVGKAVVPSIGTTDNPPHKIQALPHVGADKTSLLNSLSSSQLESVHETLKELTILAKKLEYADNF
uniref:Shugoshin_C domain-containing protein n=2 Tax=Mesocestoides corti TaxID=53468 RepID=A0A5K3EKD8_MESCO